MKPNKLLAALLLLCSLTSMARAQDSENNEKHFSRQQLENDITYLTAVIARVHPDMYHHCPKVQYEKITDSVRQVMYDGMTEREAWPPLARLVGAIGEGHSTFDFPPGIIDRLKNGGRLLFPVSISRFDGRNLVVNLDRSNENQLLPGDQITSINGISAGKLIDTLSGYAGGLKTFRALDVCRNIITFMYLYRIESPYHIAYLRNGNPGSATLTAVNWPELRDNQAARKVKLPAASGQPADNFTYLDKTTAYFNITHLTEKPEIFKHYLDSCFTILKKRPAVKLIIDFRKNGGGNSVLGETLLGYITGKPFRMSGGERWKVSAEYKQRIRENSKDTAQMAFYLNAPDGSIISGNAEKPKIPAPNPLRYTGKVFVLIGPNTFSSANMTVNAIQDYHLATLVGEPTGEPANDYGELIFLKLPNTGLSFATSTKQFVRANGDSKDQHPVLPKYDIADDLATPQDEVLDFIKKL
ncbi:S41 family peptidase [Mucilaginibacter ginsenosidivorax]|nr:S41 family peptidase [Mucilaginibacter ginsenosidivorax]